MIVSLNNRKLLWVFAVVLLLVAAWLRFRHVVDFVEWLDEIWSVWHVRGSFSEAMSRVPYDWPPLFSAVTWFWQQVAGDRLEVARYLMGLLGVLGAAFTYQAALALNRVAGRPSNTLSFVVISMLVWAVSAYGIFAGVDVRAYGLLLTTGMLTIWQTLRWLDRPSWKRGALINAALAVMVYSSYTSLTYIVILSGIVLVLKPRIFWRWLVILACLLVVSLPIVPNFLATASGRLSVMPQPLPPFGEAVVQIVREFAGADWFILVLGLAAALLVYVFVHYPSQRRLAILLLVWMAAPLVVYVVIGNREFWKPRYLWWVLIGLVLFTGYALSFLPRRVFPVVMLGLLFLPLMPVNWSDYGQTVVSAPPFRSTLSWLALHMRPGDVVVIDPKCTCGEPIGWDYFVPQYFPTNALPIVDHPGTASRVWYLSNDGFGRDDALFAEVQEGRKPSIFVGPWNFLWRLYEGPPERTGVTFGDAVQLNGMELGDNRSILGEAETFQVKLWWSAPRKIDVDYSISLVVMDGHGTVLAQVDGPASAPDTPTQTSAWEPGSYYEDYRTLTLPASLTAGRYFLAVTVYQWWDGVRLKPQANTLFPRISDLDYLILKDLTIFSY